MSIAAVPIAICFRRKSSYMGKTVAIISMILLGMIISFYQFNQLTDKAEDTFNKYLLRERGEKGKTETIAILDNIYKSHGPLRLLNIPLSMLNPPPRNLYYIFMPPNGLHDIVLQADIWQWWLGLPFLVIGTITIIIRQREFLAFLLPYFVATIIPALLLGGLQPGIYRYRDSLVPVAFIIIGAGIEDFLISSKGWKSWIITAVYTMFVVCAIFVYFYIRNV